MLKSISKLISKIRTAFWGKNHLASTKHFVVRIAGVTAVCPLGDSINTLTR